MSARATAVWFIDTPDATVRIREGLINSPDDARTLIQPIYGDKVLVPAVDTDLATATAAVDADSDPDSIVYVGSYGGLAVVVCPLFVTARPSTLTKTIMAVRTSHVVTLLHTDPGTALGAFARWEAGTLRRAFLANPVTIYEDEGIPFVFERPFWAGECPIYYAPGAQPELMALPFHPQELAEQANRDWLGFRFTHPLADTDTDPATIPVTGFRVHPAGYVAAADHVVTAADHMVARTVATPQPAPPDQFPEAPATPPAGKGKPKGRFLRRLRRYFGL